MKYWRGYLIAALFGAFGWGLTEFAKSHITLMDIVYPYMSRMIVSSMADWSAGADFCIWQVLLIVGIVLMLASVVLMLVFKWNPIQWFGWVLAVISLVSVLNLGVYGLNTYTGDLADDIRLQVVEHTVSELETTAMHYRDQANALAQKISRDEQGAVQFEEFSVLANKAGDGFKVLTYKEGLSIFAGSTAQVKPLAFTGMYGNTIGVTVGITGEAAVNPDIPDLMLPFAMCREMAHRLSIKNDADANYAAIIACRANKDEQFQYCASFMAYNYCVQALRADTTTTGTAALERVVQGQNQLLTQDMEACAAYLGSDTYSNSGSYQTYDLLVSGYVMEYILPNQVVEEEVFDPMDESQVDLTTTVVDITPTQEEDGE